MRLTKIDLTNIVAIAHSDGYLHLLLDRGNSFESVEIPAPIEAYEGLQQLNEIVANPHLLPSDEEPIAMLPVGSSMANAVGYDSNQKILQVEFHNGVVYQYAEVNEDTWEDFHQAESIGRFFNDEIKGAYKCERVEDTDNFCC